MKTKKEDILWKINSPDTLQLWPKSSRECYISPPFLPEEFVSDANGIFAPKNGSLDILGLYGIKNAAFTTHRSQYYSERVKKKFPTIIYTLRGTAKVSFAGTSHALKKGSVFLSATGSSSVLKAGRCWDVLWFHIKGCSEWENILGRECLVKQSILADSVASAAKIYAREIYSREPSVCVLENAAVLLCALLRKEFSKNDSVCAMITRAIGTAEKFPCRAPSACKLAKSLSISVYELNKACCKIKSRSYAGILSDAKMRIAADKISEGLPLSECAKIAGYSNIFALSKAFKRRYGISPSKFAGKT